MDVRHNFKDAPPTLASVGRCVLQNTSNLVNQTVEKTVRGIFTVSRSLHGFYEEVIEDMQSAATDFEKPGEGGERMKKPGTILRKRVYDIKTLLELREKCTGTCHLSKFSRDAINGRCSNSLKFFQTYLKQHLVYFKSSQNIIKPSKIASGNDSRVRGLSNVSEISNVSVASESEEILFKRDGPREQGWPVRQPEDPPDSPLAQIHAGFRKFLKEHSSPPYSRVTAGGRIVPASPPATSPTYFNLGAIDNVIHGQANVTAAINPVLPGPPRNVEDQVRSNAVAASDTSYMAAASGGSQADSRLSSASFVTALPRTGFSQIQANMAIPHQIPTFPTPLPAGSRILMITLQGAAIVVVNNMLYEATSVGPNTILAPLQVLKPNPQLAPIPMYPAHGTIPPVPMIPMQTMPLVNMTNNVPVAFSHPSRDSLQRQHDELRVQLEQLDKHVALHRSELGSQALAALVARRVQLVVKLDKTRVAKEQLVKTAPVPLRPSGEQPKEGRQQFGFGNGLASQYVSGAGLPAVSGGPRIHSAFFPPHPSGPNYDVPTLVPAAYRGDTNGWRMNGNTHNIETSTWQTNGSQAPQVRLNNNNSSVSQYESPGGGRKNSAQRPRKNTLNAEAPVWEYGSTNVPQGSIVSAGHCSPSSNAGSGPSWAHGSAPPPNETLPQGHNIEQIGVERGLPIYGVVNRQPFDIPLVTEEQASYATMLDLNPRVGPKKYCTTPAEFAEVIRQAREQATLFGRLGHSINDPQWDAEKDVRWAMEDDEPVPLPNVVPKYFSDPRPWSWPSKAYGDETAHLTFDSKTGWGEPVNGGQGIYKMDETTGFRPGYDSPAWTRPSFQKLPRIVHGPGGSHTYAHQNTTSGNYPPKPVFSQATWIENDNGNITKRTNHAYVEDAPNTPSRHGSETRSVTVRAVSGQTHGTVPLAWELPSLDECKGKAKAKDSWATNSQDDPNYPPLPASQRFRKFSWDKPVSNTVERFNPGLPEASSAVSSAGHTNDQKEFLRTMLKNYPAASNDFADFQTRVDEELHGAGRNADGTQMGVVDRSLSINKENQKGGSHFDAETFPKVVAREKTGSNVAWNTSGSQHTGVHKAQSSVASQLYQAHGQLPQYDGAADSLSSGGAPASSDRASDKVGDAKAKVKLAGWLSSVSPSLYEPGRRLLVSERRHREAIDKLFQAIRKVEREEIANYKAKFVVKDSQLARSFQSEP